MIVVRILIFMAPHICRRPATESLLPAVIPHRRGSAMTSPQPRYLAYCQPADLRQTANQIPLRRQLLDCLIMSVEIQSP